MVLELNRFSLSLCDLNDIECNTTFPHCFSITLIADTVGESYDECWKSFENAARDQSENTECLYTIPTISDSKSVGSSSTTISSDSRHSSHSKIAAADPMTNGISTEGFGYSVITTSPRDLYEMRPSRVAVEGYDDSQTTTVVNTKMIPNPTNSKVAGLSTLNMNRGTNHYERCCSESNVAAPGWTPVSYIYCRA